MHAVFLDQQTFSATVSLTAVKAQLSSLTCYSLTAPEQVVARCQNAEVVLTNKVVLTRAMMTQLPALKLVCVTATGYNNVDLTAAKSLNIAVTNVSGYAKNSVAQYVFAQLLAHFSQIEHHNNNGTNGLWQRSDTFCVHGKGSDELAGKSIAIIGYGALGAKVAAIAKAFEMNVLIAERPGVSEIRPGRVAFSEAIKQADIISLHCPHTEQNEGLFNQAIFAQMKPSAVFINTARGALVNNKDLLSALQQGQLGYAILDVLDQEPPSDEHILIKADLDNLKITAHIAWASKQAQQSLIERVADNIHAFNNKVALNRLD